MSTDRPPEDRTERTVKSLIVPVDRKQFTLILRENHRGHYLRITEENHGRFNSVVVPADDPEALEKFIEALRTLKALAESSPPAVPRIPPAPSLTSPAASERSPWPGRVLNAPGQ
jgi:hypothetical protein